MFILIFLLPNIAGSFGLRFVPVEQKVGRLICYYLTGPYNAAFVMVLSMQVANTAGATLTHVSTYIYIYIYALRRLTCTGHTKKVVTNAVLFLGYCTGNLAGPFFYKDDQKLVNPFYAHVRVHANVQAYLRFGYLVHDRLASYRSRPYRDPGISSSLGKSTAGSYPVADGRWVGGERFGRYCVFGFDGSGE